MAEIGRRGLACGPLGRVHRRLELAGHGIQAAHFALADPADQPVKHDEIERLHGNELSGHLASPAGASA